MDTDYGPGNSFTTLPDGGLAIPEEHVDIDRGGGVFSVIAFSASSAVRSLWEDVRVWEVNVPTAT
jgi:hypothetical protein